MAEFFDGWRCDVCRQKSLRRVQRPYDYDVSHDGRAPVTIRISDLEVIACTNPDCKPEDPGATIIIDDAATARITEETYKQLGLLTPAEIRAGREKLGLTQQQLQELLGLGGNSLSRWENSHIYQSRSLDRLLRLALEVPPTIDFLKNLEFTTESHLEVTDLRFEYVPREIVERVTSKQELALDPSPFPDAIEQER